MTLQEFKDIFSDDKISGSKIDKVGCNVFEGLKIINKYLPNQSLVLSTSYYMIHSVEIKELIKKKITKQDVKELSALNWGITDEQLTCFI